MINRTQKFRRQQAGALLVTLLFCSILGVLIGSYLSLIQNQYLSVARGQSWNKALVVAEAGVEEAMAHLNSGVTTNFAVNTWVNSTPGVYTKTNFVGTDFTVVEIKVQPAVTNVYPVIFSQATVEGPLSRPNLSRTVRADTKPKSVLAPPRGMVSLGLINLNGNGILVDSFDSSSTNYSTGGLYDPKKARDRAQVTSLSGGTNAITVDNGKIKGLVRVAATGKIALGPNGSVGDAAYVNAGKKGIQPGHEFHDADFTAPEVKLPEGTWVKPIPGSYKVQGVTYKYVLNDSANWKLPTLDGNVLISSPNVVLQVTDSFSFDGLLKIAPDSTLSMYVASPNVALSGQGIMNGTGQASAFNYYGLPTHKSFSLAANASFVGWVVAPDADFVLGGGGRDTYDYVGACLAKTVTMNGHFNFHYDESLVPPPPPTGYVAIAWDEL
jgi:hypothetical protein